jgi:enoyl-CoA hydratase/carnithine racemase
MNQKHITHFHLKILGDLIKAFKKLDNDKNIKVIIIEGAGKGFSAGHNLKEVNGVKKKRKIPKTF